MTSKRELKLAYALAGILLVVGIFSYAAFSAVQPDQPLRVMYSTVAGKVLFNHKAHFSPDGYGISCRDCHHHPAEDDIDLQSCSDCHQAVGKDQSVPKTCLDCHDSSDIEGTKIIKSADAAHGQCIGCHKDYGAGPVDCKGCHVS